MSRRIKNHVLKDQEYHQIPMYNLAYCDFGGLAFSSPEHLSNHTRVNHKENSPLPELQCTLPQAFFLKFERCSRSYRFNTILDLMNHVSLKHGQNSLLYLQLDIYQLWISEVPYLEPYSSKIAFLINSNDSTNTTPAHPVHNQDTDETESAPF